MAPAEASSTRPHRTSARSSLLPGIRLGRHRHERWDRRPGPCNWQAPV